MMPRREFILVAENEAGKRANKMSINPMKDPGKSLI